MSKMQPLMSGKLEHIANMFYQMLGFNKELKYLHYILTISTANKDGSSVRNILLCDNTEILKLVFTKYIDQPFAPNILSYCLNAYETAEIPVIDVDKTNIHINTMKVIT